MDLVTWVIAGILAVDLLIVLGLGTAELRARRRNDREIEQLDALWRTPATQPVQVERSVGALRVRTSRVATAPVASRRLGAVSLGTAAIAFVSLVIVAIVGGTPGLIESLPVPSPRADIRPVERNTPRSVDQVSSGHDAGEAMLDRLDDESVAPNPPPTVSSGVAPVESVAAVATSPSSIVIVWDEVDTAIGYDIERRREQDGTPDWTWIGQTRGKTRFTDLDVESATTYFYRVTAFTAAGALPPSDEISVTTPVPPPEATSLAIIAQSTTTISLEWVDVQSATGYRVERSQGGQSDWTTIATTGTDVTEYTDANLGSNTTYRYRVFAMNEGGESAPSNVASAKTDKVTGVQEPPGQEPPGHEEDGETADKGKGNGADPDQAVVVPDDETVSEEGTIPEGEGRSDEPPPPEGTT